jgi:uncharacterized protein with PIN domain
MSTNTSECFSCIYCGAKLIALKLVDIYTKPNKNGINSDDIETLHKCNQCDKNNKLYWSGQKKPSIIFW